MEIQDKKNTLLEVLIKNKKIIFGVVILIIFVVSIMFMFSSSSSNTSTVTNTHIVDGDTTNINNGDLKSKRNFRTTETVIIDGKVKKYVDGIEVI